MKRLALGLSVALLASASAFGQADLSKDERLKKPITVSLKLRPLSEALEELAKASGVVLDSAPNVKDLKCTVLVKDVPSDVVLAGLASTLDLDWTADKTTYRIGQNADRALAMRRYVEAEAKERRTAAEAEVKKVGALAALPYEEAKQRDPQLSPGRYLLAMTLRQMGTQANGFWQGQPVVNATSYMSPVEAVNGPAGEPRQTANGGQARKSPAPPRMMVIRTIAQYNPITRQIETSIGPLAGTSERPHLIDQPKPLALKEPFVDALKAWTERNDEAAGFAVPAGAVTPQSDGWAGGRISTADELEAIHRATGVPIIADAFRVPIHQGVTGRTAAELLKDFAQREGAFLRTKDGVAMLRHGAYWRLRELEPEEKAARALEKKPVTLEGYATFAQSLAPAQVMALRVPDGFLLRVPTTPIATSYRALRFYASLGANQRAAKAGSPIPFTRLGSAQRTLFLEAMHSDLFGATVLGQAAILQVPQDADRLAFQMSAVDVPVAAQGLQPGIQMLFGASERDAVAYRLALPSSG